MVLHRGWSRCDHELLANLRNFFVMHGFSTISEKKKKKHHTNTFNELISCFSTKHKLTYLIDAGK